MTTKSETFPRWGREQLQERGLAVTYRQLPMGHEISWLAQQIEKVQYRSERQP